jgi:hypothetical protein
VSDGDPLDTSAVGSHPFTVTGTDQAGNESVLERTYAVRYGFTGFLRPIDNPPVVNVANAGRTVPVKWRLAAANGTGVNDLSSFVSLTSVPTDCESGAATDGVETYAVGSDLQNLGDGYWQLNWKTPKSYAGQCRIMRLNLADTVGASATALEELGRTAAMAFR